MGPEGCKYCLPGMSFRESHADLVDNEGLITSADTLNRDIFS